MEDQTDKNKEIIYRNTEDDIVYSVITKEDDIKEEVSGTQEEIKNKIMELKFKKLNEKAVLPSRSHVTDAGLDLTTYGFTQEVDASGKLVLVYHTGLAVEIPEGYMGLLFMRSSVANKSLTLTNAVGVVDSKIYVVL